MSILEKTKAVRDEAWGVVVATPEYKAFKILDDAVASIASEPTALVAAIANRIRGKRVTQGDVAHSVLVRNGEPLPIGRWLEKCIEAGIGIKGEDPLANFRSTASRDKRFYSLMRSNMYFWWLTGVELPEGWKEAADPDLPGLSAAADSSDQEGGEDHAATTS